MAKPRPFVTANGQVTSNNTIEVKTQGIGSTTMHLLDTTCPLAVSVGEEVNKGYTFVWSRKNLPFFAQEKHVRVTCPKTKRHEAAYVRHNVPHFKIGISDSPIGSPPLHSPSGSRGGGSHFYTNNRGKSGSSYATRDEANFKQGESRPTIGEKPTRWWPSGTMRPT